MFSSLVRGLFVSSNEDTDLFDVLPGHRRADDDYAKSGHYPLSRSDARRNGSWKA
jgi:hypothetical protein